MLLNTYLKPKYVIGSIGLYYPYRCAIDRKNKFVYVYLCALQFFSLKPLKYCQLVLKITLELFNHVYGVIKAPKMS